MDRQRVLADLIRQAYEAATDPRQWKVFLDQFAREVRSPAVALIVQDLRNPQGSVSEGFGFDPIWERRYAEYFGRINVWIERAPHLFRPGIVSRTDHMIADAELMKTEFYNDFLRPQNHFYSYGGILAQESSVISYITAMRSEAAGPFDCGEVELLAELMPHLQAALRVHTRLSTLENRLEGLTEALHHLAQGVLLVDGAGKVTFLNRFAEEVVSTGAGLRMAGGILYATRPEETAKLHTAVAEAAGCGGAALGAQVMTISRPGVARDLTVSVAPLTSTHPASRGRGLAIVFVTDPDRRPDQKARELEHLLNLTAAESRLAKALADGGTLAEFAASSGVSLNTVRSQLKHIFAKTGVNRQLDLVRLVLTVTGRR